MVVVISRKRFRNEIINVLSTLKPPTTEPEEKVIRLIHGDSATVARLVSVRKQGYIMTETSSQDGSFGLVFEYALGEDKEEVLDRHVDCMVAIEVHGAKQDNLSYRVVD